MKRPLSEVFTSIEESPLGSASIAQVHRARLLTGEDVVVKVQRPGILKTVEEDVALLRQLAGLAETQLPEWRLHQPVALADELARSLEKELDFTCEAPHLDRFSWQFRDEPTVYLPSIYRDFTTWRVLVMEYVGGIKASSMDELEAGGCDRRELCAGISIYPDNLAHWRREHGSMAVINILAIAGGIGLMTLINLRYFYFWRRGRLTLQTRWHWRRLDC